MHKLRNFHLLGMLAAATATAAFAQTEAPAAAQTNGATQGVIPELSGIWAHLTWPDVEPPPSGPGPIRNMARRNGVSDVYQLVGDYSNPILKPNAAQVVRRNGEIGLSGVPAPATNVGPEGCRSCSGINSDNPAAGPDHDTLRERS